MFPLDAPTRQPRNGPVSVKSGHAPCLTQAAARKRSANRTHNAAPGAINASLKS